MAGYLSPDVAFEVLGVLLLVVFSIIISLEVYLYQNPKKFSTIVIVITLLVFTLSFLATLKNDPDVIYSVILLLGLIMGIAVGLIMTESY